MSFVDLTVSAQHARIEKKEEYLLVTDLDSTNGTFIDGKRLRPGVVGIVPPGSLVTFGTCLKLSLSLAFLLLVSFHFQEIYLS